MDPIHSTVQKCLEVQKLCRQHDLVQPRSSNTAAPVDALLQQSKPHLKYHLTTTNNHFAYTSFQYFKL